MKTCTCSAISAALKCSHLLTTLQMTVEVPPAFHIYYATGWEEPVLRVRELSPDGMPINEVPCYLLSEVGMQKTAQTRLGSVSAWCSPCICPGHVTSTILLWYDVGSC